MNFKCALSLHTWAGCKCSACGKTRDKSHDWRKDCEKCAQCSATQKDGHSWAKNCEKCSECGKTRSNAHDWSAANSKCAKCGAPNPSIQFDLGCKHALESINSGNASEAIRFFELAARAGHTEAKNMLGLFLARANGDLRGAHRWISEAADEGSKAAIGNRGTIKFLMDNPVGLGTLSYSWAPNSLDAAPPTFKLTKDPVYGQIYVVD